MPLKSAPHYCVGVDIADRTFVASILIPKTGETQSHTPFEQTAAGFESFVVWLREHRAQCRSTVIAMETTGVLGEKLCLYVLGRGYRVTVIDAASIARQRPPSRAKTDRNDSLAIAEYLFRFPDKIQLWKPKEPIFQQINALLSTREQLVKQHTALVNHRKSAAKAAELPTDVLAVVDDVIATLKAKIQLLTKSLRATIQQHPAIEQFCALLDGIPSVGLLMAANLALIVPGEGQAPNHRTLSNYLGMCPHEHSSGTSIRKKARSSRLGPPRMRKLLHLAARTLITHQKPFRDYYRYQVDVKNKPKKLVLNNVANRLLRIMCAVLRNQTPYKDNYVSVGPSWS
jgi:transposase